MIQSLQPFKFWRKTLLQLTCFVSLTASAATAETSKDDSVLLFTYFRDNGQYGVCLAKSEDGETFTPLNDDKPIFTPPKWKGQNLVRDSSILYQDGLYHMVWTSSWKGRIFGYANSKDLVNWSTPQQITPFPASLPAEDQPDNIWAPEIQWDPLKKDFFILFSSTTPREKNDEDNSNNNGKKGSTYDNRVYLTRTKDFATYTTPKVIFDQDFASIDAVMRIDEATQRWVMVIKCSRDVNLPKMPGRNLWITYTGLDMNQIQWTPLEGPIAGNHSKMFSNPEPQKSMAEGQSLLRYKNKWLLLWDEPAGDEFQIATSPDLKNWTHNRKAQFPAKGKHGTLFLAPRSTVGWLK